MQEAEITLDKLNIKINVSNVCRYFGKSRQAFYQKFIPKTSKSFISTEELLLTITLPTS